MLPRWKISLPLIALMLIPASAAVHAAAESDTYKQLDALMDVFRTRPHRLCRQDRRQEADRRRDQRHARQPRSALVVPRRARLPEHAPDHRRRIWRPRPDRFDRGRRGQGHRADRRHPGGACRHQVGRLHHPPRRRADLWRHPAGCGRQDARRPRHLDQADGSARGRDQAARIHPEARGHRHPPGQVRDQGQCRRHPHLDLQQADRRGHPQRRHQHREEAGGEPRRLHRRPALEPRRAARPGDRRVRRVPRPGRDRLAARAHQERHHALLRQAAAT